MTSWLPGYVRLGCTGQDLTVSIWLPFPKSVGAHRISGYSLLVLVPYIQNAYPLIPQSKTINDRINDITEGYKLTQVNKERNAQP